MYKKLQSTLQSKVRAMFSKIQIFFICSASLLPMSLAVEKNAEKVNREVKRIMEMMVLPRYGLYKLSGEGKYDLPDFKSASKEVIKYAVKMKTIKHPDKAFQKTNEEMLKALAVFEGAIKSGKKEQLKSTWLILNEKCNNCHILYNIK